MLIFVALKTFLQLVVHMNLDVHLRKVEPGGHVLSLWRDRWYLKALTSSPQEGCLWIDFVLGTQVPGLQDQWLWFFFFFFNYLTEDIPLTDYETLNACLSTGIPLKGVFCFLQTISLQKSHQLWAWEPLSPFKLEEESGFAVATKACFLILCGYSSFAIFRGWDGECSGLTEI